MSFAALVARLGHRHALQELRWIRQTLPLHDQPSAIQRRLAGEPLQYILGNQPFGPLNLLVRPPVLIPRPETEHWTIKLSQSLSPTPRRPLSLLDLGTGSGCIPLLLCHLWPSGSLRALGIDCSPDAVKLATDNALRSAIPTNSASFPRHNVFKPELASFLSPSLLDLVDPPFDIITSNPPYIPLDEYLTLDTSVKDYEDHIALFGGEDGLDYYRAIANLVAINGILTRDALIVLEVGHTQAESVQAIMRTAGKMDKTQVWHDPWGKPRTVVAWRS